MRVLSPLWKNKLHRGTSCRKFHYCMTDMPPTYRQPSTSVPADGRTLPPSHSLSFLSPSGFFGASPFLLPFKRTKKGAKRTEKERKKKATPLRRRWNYGLRTFVGNCLRIMINNRERLLIITFANILIPTIKSNISKKKSSNSRIFFHIMLYFQSRKQKK